MGILAWFRPKWKHAESDVRLGAVTRLCNYSALAWVIRNDPDPRVRGGAIERLDSLAMSDQSTLADVARNHSDAAVRRIAVLRVRDQSILADVAKSDSDSEVRKAADQALLARVVKTDPDPTVRNSALARLEDQAVLADVARTASDLTVRKAALARCGPDDVGAAVVIELAKNATDAEVRKAATARFGELFGEELPGLMRDQADFVRKALGWQYGRTSIDALSTFLSAQGGKVPDTKLTIGFIAFLGECLIHASGQKCGWKRSPAGDLLITNGLVEYDSKLAILRCVVHGSSLGSTCDIFLDALSKYSVDHIADEIVKKCRS
jgi:hypothetical protein